MKRHQQQTSRPTRNLKLERETLRRLQDDSLRQIHGGVCTVHTRLSLAEVECSP